MHLVFHLHVNYHHSINFVDFFKVSLEEVQTNFAAFNLLDDRVRFCKGFFVDSLPKCNVSRLAVLRMDGDMYESTMDQLFNLYEKLQVGGVLIIDDYTVPVCYKAVHDFRGWHNITDEIVQLDVNNSAHYWIKLTPVKVRMEKYTPLLVTKVPRTK
jgi:O-methyltransferase